MKPSTIHSITYAAIGAALLAVLSKITIPVQPVPFTLQTLAVGLIATLYKPKEATTSVLIYLLLGAIGLPVFSGSSAGFSVLFGTTAGFLWAFLLYGLITSLLVDMHSSILAIFLANCLGIAIVLLGGAIYFKFFTQTPWDKTFALAVIPFIFSGVLKIVIVIIIVKALQPILKKEAYFK